MAATESWDEFSLIARYFAPLSANFPGAFGLADDAALIQPGTGLACVLTTDTMIEGVHFLTGDPAGLVGRKLLRVNLSDLAAMGARPIGYLLAAALPRGIAAAWLDDFVRGLALDQQQFAVALVGGDTTATPGPMTLTVTAVGEAEPARLLRRAGARVGDDIYVSGTIGDAALGLRVLTGALTPAEPAAAALLVARYHLPEPRVTLGRRLVGIATAAIDVSDGLVADLGHVCVASRVAAEVSLTAVPLSAPARAAVLADPALVAAVLGGGDDYEIVFTAAPQAAGPIAAVAGEIGVPITRIGRVRPGGGVSVSDANGRPVVLESAGYRHF